MENKPGTTHRYITIPAALFGSGLSMTALCIYGFLLQRHSLSVRNNRRDEEGRVYIVYPIAELAKDVGRRKDTIINAMHELEKRKMIDVRRNEIRTASVIFVNTPEGLENPTLKVEEIPPYPGENPTHKVEETPPIRSKKFDSNNRYNNRDSNNTVSQYSNTSSPYSSPRSAGRGRKYNRKDTDSGMFAPIPDYENCEWYGL